jgi:hypothetical protein
MLGYIKKESLPPCHNVISLAVTKDRSGKRIGTLLRNKGLQISRKIIHPPGFSNSKIDANGDNQI